LPAGASIPPDTQRRIVIENLFSYGTLREETVQQAVFGRSLGGGADAVLGYRLESVTITDPAAIAISGKTEHLILDHTGRDGDRVEGAVFQITEAELALADTYEDAAYKRVLAPLRSGGQAWVYVRA
jgi:gamma-glutamylcyclotransferase (GGCT)/AIG2-like uncharacterized protein YtfP